MSTTMEALSAKVDQLAGRFGKIEEALLQVARMQVELTQVIKANDKRDSIIERLQERVIDLEKLTNVNALTLAKSERFFWIIVAVSVGLIGEFLL